MRRAFSDRVERAREAAGDFASSYGDDFGRFRLENAKPTGSNLLVLVSPGSDGVPWEHVSVTVRSNPTFVHQAARCPTWEEMCWVKSLFFEEDEAVVQYHPRAADYVNHNAYCLHLWRPLRAELPVPPPIAVGPRLLDTTMTERA